MRINHRLIAAQSGNIFLLGVNSTPLKWNGTTASSDHISRGGHSSGTPRIETSGCELTAEWGYRAGVGDIVCDWTPYSEVREETRTSCLEGITSVLSVITGKRNLDLKYCST